MKFLVQNYSCLQNPWLGGYRLQIPVLSVLCPQLKYVEPPSEKKIPGYAIDLNRDVTTAITIQTEVSTSQLPYYVISDSANPLPAQVIVLL